MEINCVSHSSWWIHLYYLTLDFFNGQLWWLRGLLAVWETPKIQHCRCSSMHYSILRTLLQRVSLSWEGGEGSFSFVLFLGRVSLVGTVAKIVNPPTKWSYDFTETCYYSCAICSCFLSPCSGLCTSDISTAAILCWMLYILRPHF